MKIKLTKTENKLCLIQSTNSEIIETYELSKTIDFSHLMSFLLKEDLKSKIEIDKCDFELAEEEKTLFSLIEKILDKYNLNIDLYNSFLEEEKKEN